METDYNKHLTERIEEAMTDRGILRKLGLQKKDMLKLLHHPTFRSGVREMAPKTTYSCKEILAFSGEALHRLSPDPAGGWLDFLFNDGKHTLYPENFPDVSEPCYETGKLFLLELLHVCFTAERDLHGFRMTLHFSLATPAETEKSAVKDEYDLFLDFIRRTYFLEFMRIAAEVTPFNTCGHIAGVHNVAMHMARQLKKTGLPVDLALMSGAAIGHDIGKFGCKDKEARRVPYLHYYYTDQCFKRNNMPQIGYIAANHSTWDLELENLSVESLLLIYADFRVKSTRENGTEKIHCYRLSDSFNVILSKLDNVDDAKRKRYQKVYSKLHDFEQYMMQLGAHTDFSSDVPNPKPEKDSALLCDGEIVTAFKNMAIYHNIQLMNILNHEASFTNILELARSDKDWKNTRTYLNIFREYNTYLNQKQKLLTISFLYELLMHRESDIRNAAATLMGEIIVGYDTEYRKEIPDGMMEFLQLSSSLEQFEKYLGMILVPDHKLTEQHRMWIGYKMETLVNSVLKNCADRKRQGYLNILHKQYQDLNRDPFTAFVMIETLERISLEECSQNMMETFLQFVMHFSRSQELEIQVVILLLLNKVLASEKHRHMAESYAYQIMDHIPNRPEISILYLKQKIGAQLHMSETALAEFDMGQDLDQTINEAFLENLKTATHWICKMVNIQYLFDMMLAGKNQQPVHTATHMVNLITGTECGDARHLAGRMLVRMMRRISPEQRNEIVMEMMKGLELGETEYSKNIPQYLGQLIIRLKPAEVDEMLLLLDNMLITASDSVACVTMDTIGYVIQRYHKYVMHCPENTDHTGRMRRLLGMVLRGLAHHHETVAQEACYVMGEFLFGMDLMSMEDTCRIFRYIGKKSCHIMKNTKEDSLSFLINAASLNSIYRFISDFTLENGDIRFEDVSKVAFFPGTFDPFSLSHEGIVKEIRKLGFEVYLATDEFSWSKRTQPPLIRRKIAAMSTADDPQVFMFPLDVPVNIANPADLKQLKEMFEGKNVYIVAGSDVTAHASAYKKKPEPCSIHQFNHIIFRRHGDEYELEAGDSGSEAAGIRGEIIELSLPIQLEDISSTRIRENIDMNRDISHLIDPMVQNYIYENNLYLREPQYKYTLVTRSITCDVLDDDEVTDAIWEELGKTILRNKKNQDVIRQNVQQDHLSIAILRDGDAGNVPIAAAIAGRLNSSDLADEFDDLDMVKRIRNIAWGKIMVIKGIYGFRYSDTRDYVQMVVTELLAHALSLEYTYCLYHGIPEMEEHRDMVEETLRRQGFVLLSEDTERETIMAVDMHCPVTLTKNIETVLKAPLNSNPRVLEVIEESHRRLQYSLTSVNPGNLVLSFDSTVMYHRLVKKIAEINGVPDYVTTPRKLGEKMCVPFGKILRGSVTPNTVTKALHTEKVFNSDMSGFTIEEYPNYTSLRTQMKTIRSFNRSVILVDDLLHKGYRMKELFKLLPGTGIPIAEILVGVMTANGRDLVTKNGMKTDSVYFIPNIDSWFVESSLYPFIGGDSIRSEGRNTAGLITSINLIMPYVMPSFLAGKNIQSVYEISMTCLENAKNILKVLEEEYQKEFERNLILERLSEVILSPTCPEKGRFMTYDENIPASYYIDNDIKQLERMRYLTAMELHEGEYRSLYSD